MTNVSSCTYLTTPTDSNGNRQPATSCEQHRVDASGQMVKEDPIVDHFLWAGMAAAALILMIVLTVKEVQPAFCNPPSASYFL